MFKEYLNNIDKLTNNLIKSNLSETYVEFKKENLPQCRGVYFIYEKIAGCVSEIPSYIGCAYKKGSENEDKKDRSIKLRCGQNLEPKNTGGTFRDSVMREELELEPYEYIFDAEKNKKKRVIIEENTTKGIEYISKNFVLKFIIESKDMSENDILLIERACIKLYNPKYNRA